MNSGLFNNKYYNQLFGGKLGSDVPDQSESSVATEDTRQRLERIFGGAKRGRKPSPERAAARDAVAKRAAMSDAEYSRETGMPYNPSTGLFTFKNGAEAKRLPNGRFKIVKGASDTTMARLRDARNPGGKVKPISKKAAQRAFSAYFNKKMAAAKAYNAAHMSEYPLKKDGTRNMRKSKVAAVRRAKEYALSHYRTESKVLNETSPKGYLYLRKEKLTKRKNAQGQRVSRRAGPAIYSFEGVAPNPNRKDKDGKLIPVSRRKAPTYKSDASQRKAEELRTTFAERMARYRVSQGYKEKATPKAKSTRTPRTVEQEL